jgi:tRNA threonylcarbamoyladenosine biosynthesis protein TsaB
LTVLGIDTSTSATVVALRLPDTTTIERRDDPPAGAHQGHATRLLGMAAELLDAAELGWRELDRIAIGAGPGAFTGLRVGVATARGLAQSLSIELVPVPSLQALALTAPLGAPVLAVIDARRREIFAAPFATPGGPQLALEAVLAPARAGELLATAGLEGEAVTAVGDGAVAYRTPLEAAGLTVAPDGAPEHLLRAAAICELGEAAPAAGDYQLVLPEYLRRPDAELSLQAGAAGGGGR